VATYAKVMAMNWIYPTMFSKLREQPPQEKRDRNSEAFKRVYGRCPSEQELLQFAPHKKEKEVGAKILRKAEAKMWESGKRKTGNEFN
jgi:hypothetical protein